MDAGLIHIERVEAEEHGILQKYYSPIAALLIIDPARMPKDVQRYFIWTQLEHLRGVFSVFQPYHHASKVSSKTMEKMAVAMLKQLKAVDQKHTEDEAPEDAEALTNLTKQEEWRTLFQKST